MIAGKVDIGSMGDYPLLVNGSKTSGFGADRSVLVGVTGYNLRGSLNQVVVPSASGATTLDDLRGRIVSTSLGSAGHGMLVDGLQRSGLATTDVQLLNQEPAVGASAVQADQVGAYAQFVPWPQLLIFRGQAKLLYDGGDNGKPTFHGIVARESFGTAHPELMQAFLQSVKDTSDYIDHEPLAAAETVSRLTGIEAEVVYLYNGPNGLVTFDPTIKQPLVDALAADLPFLKQVGSAGDLDVAKFVDETALRAVYGAGYDAARASTPRLTCWRARTPCAACRSATRAPPPRSGSTARPGPRSRPPRPARCGPSRRATARRSGRSTSRTRPRGPACSPPRRRGSWTPRPRPRPRCCPSPPRRRPRHTSRPIPAPANSTTRPPGRPPEYGGRMSTRRPLPPAPEHGSVPGRGGGP
ncbi:ABC transporter substrate-binding protein [Pseudonocardia benzenivorans]